MIRSEVLDSSNCKGNSKIVGSRREAPDERVEEFWRQLFVRLLVVLKEGQSKLLQASCHDVLDGSNAFDNEHTLTKVLLFRAE